MLALAAAHAGTPRWTISTPAPAWGSAGSGLEDARQFLAFLAREVRKAQEVGDLDAGADPEQIAFELDALGARPTSTTSCCATRRRSTAP